MMKKEQIFLAMNDVDETLLARCPLPQTAAGASDEKKKTARPLLKQPFRRILCGAAAAACLVLALLLVPKLSAQNQNPDTFRLSDASHGVSVYTMDQMPDSVSDASYDLAWLTEEELFTRYDTVIFAGTVTGIQNIVIDYNGDKHYHAIASIEIETVLRGDLKEGSTVDVLLPCPINTDGIWMEDTGVISQLRVGTHGIFMPAAYGADSIREHSGARLMLTDIAPYGFLDGERYAFLETDDGILFSRWAYESIGDASTLLEIEAYIERMLKNGTAE